MVVEGRKSIQYACPGCYRLCNQPRPAFRRVLGFGGFFVFHYNPKNSHRPKDSGHGTPNLGDQHPIFVAPQIFGRSARPLLAAPSQLAAGSSAKLE